mmetsp:Transcript_25418/g.35424  ORF Transcript_25418/g.35424 Transcript_25418/m.35424 type:complete len:628 (-) Transcript_25418:317-2200(-)
MTPVYVGHAEEEGEFFPVHRRARALAGPAPRSSCALRSLSIGVLACAVYSVLVSTSGGRVDTRYSQVVADVQLPAPPSNLPRGAGAMETRVAASSMGIAHQAPPSSRSLRQQKGKSRVNVHSLENPEMDGQPKSKPQPSSSTSKLPLPRRQAVSGLAAVAAGVVGSASAGRAFGKNNLLPGSSTDIQANAETGAKALQKANPNPSGQESSTEVVECLFQKCRLELFECLANTVCAANLVCLSTCTGRPDEIDCQVKCGDLFQTSAIDKFNDCAISRGKCVPQKPDDDLYPVPQPESLVPSFDMAKFTGNWYITMGANKLFDTFDCQLHTFRYDDKKKSVTGDIRWRVSTPDGGYLQREVQQTFRQDKNEPALLINDGNEFLHYSDNWYIASAQFEDKDTDHVFVYYRGTNDAWDGYGGAVLYTRTATVPKGLEATIKEACAKLPPGVQYSTLVKTNNQCEKQAPLIERLEKTTEKVIEEESKILASAIEKEEEQIFEGIEERVLALEGEFYKDESINKRIGQEVVNDLAFLLKGVGSEIGAAEKGLEGYAKKLGNAIIQGEKQFEAKEKSFFGRLSRAFTRQEQKVLEELEMDVKDVEDLLGKTFGSGSSFVQSKRSSIVTGTASAQ